MKKILLATTALVISAAAADAQAVRIGGEGRMGIQYNNFNYRGDGREWHQENRLQLNFTVSVQGDHGLSFGAFTRVRITNGGTPAYFGPANGANSGFSGSRVWVEANNLRLTFGNVDGAIRGAGASHGYAGGAGIGYEGGEQAWDTAGLLGVTQGFQSQNGGPGQRLRIDYSFGETRVAVSHDRDGATEFGIRSTFDAFTVALGYSNRPAGDVVTVSGHYNGGTWGVGAIVARIEGAPDVTNWSLSGNVELGGGNLYGYVGEISDDSTYGLSYSYGLGGGARLVVGAERRSGHGTFGSVGVVFTF